MLDRLLHTSLSSENRYGAPIWGFLVSVGMSLFRLGFIAYKIKYGINLI